jgi:uncharacterized protein (TIGR00288 family)
MHPRSNLSAAARPARTAVAPLHRGPQAMTAGAHSHAPNAALLIDFDNVTMGIRSDLQTELRNLLSSAIISGKVAVQRAYADWRRYPQYIVPLSESSIDLIFAPAYGSSKKNATDIRLAVDAIELVFTRPEIGTYILLSGDSDFSSLVLKLKEYGKYVIGVGIRESSSDLLVQNCDEYYSYNALAGLVKSGEESGTKKWDPYELVTEAIGRMQKNGDVMRSDRLKQVMQEIDASFDEKDLGMSKFSRFCLEAQSKGLLHVHKLENGQLEVGPPKGKAVESAAASSAPTAERERERGEREEREGRGRRGRRGRGGRGRDRDDRPREGGSTPAEGTGRRRRCGRGDSGRRGRCGTGRCPERGGRRARVRRTRRARAARAASVGRSVHRRGGGIRLTRDEAFASRARCGRGSGQRRGPGPERDRAREGARSSSVATASRSPSATSRASSRMRTTRASWTSASAAKRSRSSRPRVRRASPTSSPWPRRPRRRRRRRRRPPRAGWVRARCRATVVVVASRRGSRRACCCSAWSKSRPRPSSPKWPRRPPRRRRGRGRRLR